MVLPSIRQYKPVTQQWTTLNESRTYYIVGINSNTRDTTNLTGYQDSRALLLLPSVLLLLIKLPLRWLSLAPAPYSGGEEVQGTAKSCLVDEGWSIPNGNPWAVETVGESGQNTLGDEEEEEANEDPRRQPSGRLSISPYVFFFVCVHYCVFEAKIFRCSSFG